MPYSRVAPCRDGRRATRVLILPCTTEILPLVDDGELLSMQYPNLGMALMAKVHRFDIHQMLEVFNQFFVMTSNMARVPPFHRALEHSVKNPQLFETWPLPQNALVMPAIDGK